MKISVLTPTANRTNWFVLAVECMKRQTWFDLGHEIEWIIVEDGEQDVRTLLTDLPPGVEIRYTRLAGKRPIGHKRNVCLDMADTPILVFWDDDDYYQPEYIQHMATLLVSQFAYGVVGSPQLYAYSNGSIYLKGKYGNHSPCGVLGFTAKAMKQYEMRFNDEDTHGEERAFLKDFCVPLLASDPRKTIVAIQHGQNTWKVSFENDTPMQNRCLPDWADILVKKQSGFLSGEKVNGE
jgi:glycosyltransferase involved in cell wall biosynthesis